MPRPKRLGVKPLQVRAAGWVHEVIAERTTEPGVESWMVVEDLMKKGLKAEKDAISLSSADNTNNSNTVITEAISEEAYYHADACIVTYFQKEAGVFMQTISRLKGDKKSLTASDWRKWKKAKRVPEFYVHSVRTLITVINGLDMAMRRSGYYDPPRGDK